MPNNQKNSTNLSNINSTNNNHGTSSVNGASSGNKITTVLAHSLEFNEPENNVFPELVNEKNYSGQIAYTDTKVIGNGSFGVVFQAKLVDTGELVAIKKVLQDKRFKNRELQIMMLLYHCNIVRLRYYFYCTGEKKDDVFLNLVLEYVPETVYRVARHYSKSKQSLPLIYVKLYLYQLFRALNYIHLKCICHRDIKPQNLLLDPETSVLKLCDFGSAKVLVKGEPNVSYICSRYYRAPELIFGATDYSWNIDIWSSGCVLAELLLGHPLFPGDSGVDQLVEIIKVLGTPTREQIRQMNPNYVEFKFPYIKAHPWTKVFKSKVAPEAVDLISKLLEYIPSQRLDPLQACAHAFFDELRLQTTKLPNGNPLPPLFNFSPMEFTNFPNLKKLLIPEWYKEEPLFATHPHQTVANSGSSKKGPDENNQIRNLMQNNGQPIILSSNTSTEHPANNLNINTNNIPPPSPNTATLNNNATQSAIVS